MIDLKDLEYLQMVSKTGAINKAADRLGITQPALTRRIQRLEKQFDLRLLDRQPKGVKLTEIGEAFLLSGQSLLAHSRDFENEMKRHSLGRTGILKVGIKPGLDDLFFTKSLALLAEQYPEVVVKLFVDATPGLMRKLRNGDLDFAYGAQGYADDEGKEIIMSNELAFEPMMEVPLTPYLRAGHPALSQKDVSTAIFDYPLIGPTPPANIINAILEGYKSRGQNFVVPQILVDDFVLSAKLVGQTNHWSAIFSPLFNGLAPYGDFVNLGQTAIMPPLTIGIVRRKTWSYSPWANKLNEIIRSVAQQWLI